MADKWEWDTFKIINEERRKHHLNPLEWCCGLENNIRGSCGGIKIKNLRIDMKTLKFTCPHWTFPQVIARQLMKHKDFTNSNLFKPQYKSGVVIITNDKKRTYVKFACGKHNAISWDELRKGLFEHNTLSTKKTPIKKEHHDSKRRENNEGWGNLHEKGNYSSDSSMKYTANPNLYSKVKDTTIAIIFRFLLMLVGIFAIFEPWCQYANSQSIVWLVLSIILSIVFIPITLVFLFSFKNIFKIILRVLHDIVTKDFKEIWNIIIGKEKPPKSTTSNQQPVSIQKPVKNTQPLSRATIKDILTGLREIVTIDLRKIWYVIIGSEPPPPPPPSDQKPLNSQELAIEPHTNKNIGRDPSNDIILSHPTVSQKHASIIWKDEIRSHIIEDFHTMEGTFVNGKRIISPQLLCTGDYIKIGPVLLTYKLIYKPEKPHAIDQSLSFKIDAYDLNQKIKGGNLLKDISLSIKPNEFVAIVGPSGSGKTTLLNALSGFRPASSGAVLLNGFNLISNYDAYRSQLGYVPQEHIIHKQLTAYEALDYSARLRMPPDTSSKDRKKRVMEVLDTLGLTDCRDRVVEKLSGGEKQRVSIGVELLTRPGLLFLDEPLANQDVEIKEDIMTLLGDLSDQGQTIVLVTHDIEYIVKCHLVVVFAPHGYLAFIGTPQEVLSYFNKTSLNKIYKELDPKKITPEEVARRFKESSYYKKYVTERLPPKHVRNSSEMSRATSPGRPSNKVSSLRQFFILSRRNFSILFRDKLSLILMLFVPPLIATLDFLFWKKGLFDVDVGDARLVIMNLFMAAIVCYLVGVLSSSREMVKEVNIYKRERMVFLRIVPYVLSKVCVAVLFALYSSAIFILFMELAGGWPPSDIRLVVYFIMVLSVLGGALMGFFISVLSDKENVTPLLLLLVLVPQILFGGLIPSHQIGQAGNVIGYVTTTKWTFESLVKVSGIGDDVANDPYWNTPENERATITEEQKGKTSTSAGVNIFKESNFPGIQKFYVKEIDEPEPTKPTNYNDPQYQNDLATWQQSDLAWNAARSKAISVAEGTIKVTYDDFGRVFKTNIILNLSLLFLIPFILFFMVLRILKWKDRRYH